MSRIPALTESGFEREVSSLAEIEVLAPDGTPVRIGELVDRPTILIIPRYYGCLPCRDYLRQAAQRYGEIEAIGARAVGLSVGADFQAAWLIEQYGIPFPLLVDPERKVYDALDLPRKLSVVLNPRGWAKYASAIARGNRQGKIIDPLQLPGLALLDETARPITVHRGRALGDYPPLDSVLRELSNLDDAPRSGAPASA